MFCSNLGAVLTIGGGGGGSLDYWYLATSLAGNAEGVDIASDGTIAVTGRTPGNYFVVSAAGVITASKSVIAAGLTQNRGIAYAGADVVYAGVDGTNRPVAVKDTAAGVNVWDTGISGLSGSGIRGIVVDSTGAIIFNYLNSAGNAINIVKLSSAGALVWQRAWTYPALGAVYVSNGRNICVDASNNVIVNVGTGGFTPAVHVLKLDSSGATLWMRKYTDGNNANPITPFDMACGPDGTAVIVGTTDVAGTVSGIILSYTSSGSLAISTRMNPGTNNVLEFKGVDVGTDNAIYVAGTYANSAGTQQYACLVKFTQAGAITWQNRWYATSGLANAVGFLGVAVKDFNLLACGLDQLGGSAQCLLNVPTDGTLLGVYGSYTYAATTFVLAALPDYLSTTGTAVVGSTANSLSAFTGVTGSNSTARTLTDIPFSGTPPVTVTGWLRNMEYDQVTGPYRAATVGTKDSSGNTYMSGIQFTSNQSHIQKFNAAGDILWQIQYGITGAQGQILAMCSDSASNLYFVAAGNSQYFIVKLNSAGTLVWQYSYVMSPWVTGTEARCAMGPDGNPVFVLGTSGRQTIDIVKFSSGGSVLWCVNYSVPGNPAPAGVAIDSTGSIYVLSVDYYLVRSYADLIKLTSAGVITATSSYPLTTPGGAAQSQGGSLWLDDSNNLYLSLNGAVVKYASTGVELWGVRLSPAFGSGQVLFSAGGYTDPATGYTYAVHIILKVSTTEFLVCEIDLTGNTTWQNRIFATGTDVSSISMMAGSPGTFQVAANKTGSTGIYGSMFKLPADGSKLGTYSVYTYTANSYTSGIWSHPAAAGAVTPSYPTRAATAASNTVTTASIPSTFISIT